MKTTKPRNFLDFFTAVKPFVGLFRPFFLQTEMTERALERVSATTICLHVLLED